MGEKFLFFVMIKSMPKHVRLIVYLLLICLQMGWSSPAFSGMWARHGAFDVTSQSICAAQHAGAKSQSNQKSVLSHLNCCDSSCLSGVFFLPTDSNLSVQEPVSLLFKLSTHPALFGFKFQTHTPPPRGPPSALFI